ncbi:Lysophospholipase L1 [Porphyromonadaceae bacterium KH3R12]|uniref:SGNH/GDSL hydrolase family protein n=1 Tax=Proteiniphilum saccharofermentans TaxID=1642647 RepID=UPI00089644BD|nr:SGNH/GDSL hydrolase family protein [Proteiniphilum saccharofermentans]SDZ85363.1 Lysophospholipase L1 [Porphyromonadaceae bacterium KH3R12]
MNTRRDFFNKVVAGGVFLSLSDIAASAITTPRRRAIHFRNDNILLFQGDSLTDAGRDREYPFPNAHQTFGRGYVIQTAGELLVKYAGKNLSIYNKGISGDKVQDLTRRWKEDCIDLKPDILSILIGINDFMQAESKDYTRNALTYEKELRSLLDQTMTALPKLQLIIGEPFVITGIKKPRNHEGHPVNFVVDEALYNELGKYRAVAREIADELNAVFIPYQKIFDEAKKYAPPVYWSHDGIHASIAGTRLMATAWLQATEGRIKEEFEIEI